MGVVFRQSAKGAVVTLIGAGLGFITLFFVATYFLTPAQVGLTRLFAEVATLIGGIALMGMQSSVVRYYPHFRTEDGGDKGFLWWVLLVPLVGFLVFGTLYVLFREPLTLYFGENDNGTLYGRYFLVALPLMLAIMYQTVLEVYASVKQRVAVPKAIREVVLRLLLLVVYCVYGLGGVSFSSFLVLFVGSYLVAAIMVFLYVVKLNPKGLSTPPEVAEPSVRHDFLHYTLFTLLSSLGSTIVARLDLFMVSSQMGLAYAGIYSIAFFITAIIEMPARSLVSMSAPFVSSALHSGDMGEVDRWYKRVSHHQVLVAVILFVLIWTNIDTLFALMPRSEVYAQGKWVVLLLGLARITDLSFSLGNSILRYSRYYPWTLAYTILVTFTTIILNFYLIEWIGMEGAAVGTLVAYLVSYAFQQLILNRKLHVTPLSRPLLQIYAIFLALLFVEALLPKSHICWFDSLWRTLVVAVVGWLLLRRQSTFGELYNHFRNIFYGKRRNKKKLEA